MVMVWLVVCRHSWLSNLHSMMIQGLERPPTPWFPLGMSWTWGSEDCDVALIGAWEPWNLVLAVGGFLAPKNIPPLKLEADGVRFPSYRMRDMKPRRSRTVGWLCRRCIADRLPKLAQQNQNWCFIGCHVGRSFISIKTCYGCIRKHQVTIKVETCPAGCLRTFNQSMGTDYVLTTYRPAQSYQSGCHAWNLPGEKWLCADFFVNANILHVVILFAYLVCNYTRILVSASLFSNLSIDKVI